MVLNVENMRELQYPILILQGRQSSSDDRIEVNVLIEI